VAGHLRDNGADLRRRGSDSRAREESGQLDLKAATGPSPKSTSQSKEVDAIINAAGDWKGKQLAELRALVERADPNVVEVVKWKKPSNPMGVPSMVRPRHSLHGWDAQEGCPAHVPPRSSAEESKRGSSRRALRQM
jgi:hypothetical protein